jgi:hypothetical protein
MEGFGAFILGRNMFGPAGDDWGGPDWKGWWGDNPPYHAPTFVFTPIRVIRLRWTAAPPSFS